METKDMIAETARMVNEMQGQDDLCFDTPVTVRISHFEAYPMNFLGISVSPSGRLFVFTDNKGSWYELEATDINADKVATSLYQRVKLMYCNVVKPKYPTCVK